MWTIILSNELLKHLVMPVGRSAQTRRRNGDRKSERAQTNSTPVSFALNKEHGIPRVAFILRRAASEMSKKSMKRMNSM
jgi:hypothetical protein